MPGKIALVSVSVSWWLLEGDEQCPYCGLAYLRELECRCADCDGPACPHCAVIVRQGHSTCPECAPAAGATGGAR